jgi:hypothetical protein
LRASTTFASCFRAPSINTGSPHWRRWLKPDNRCVVPATSFCEWTDSSPKVTHWFALGEDRPRNRRPACNARQLRIGDLEGAETAFVEILALAPNNGWSLYGLSEVHRARGEMEKAATTKRKLRETWIGDNSLLTMERL